MALQEYRRKRDFKKTREPRGGARQTSGKLRFVVQKHAARRLHYDFRLELDGVLKCWAVPKGPSLDPTVKSLAVQVEDHPLEYADFEGVIPKGEYGGGTVIVWDEGTWMPLEDAHRGLQKGRLSFELRGQRLRGIWNLVRMGSAAKNWLLIKHDDDGARRGDGHGVVERATESVLSGRRLQEVSDARDWVWTNSDASAKSSRSKGRTSRTTTKSAAIPVKSATGRTRATKRTTRPRRSRKQPKSPPGARAAPFPRVVQPQLASLVDSAPPGEKWIHELKFDGYRILCYLRAGNVRLVTRRGQDWTHRFPEVANAAAKLTADSAVLDGEVVALDKHGISRFQRLQTALQNGGSRELTYYAFDLPYFNDEDLRAAALVERKRTLQELLVEANPGNDGVVRYSDHVVGHGQRVHDEACHSRWEGIVSKRADSPYEGRRTRTWLKSKCHRRQEFVIGGFTRPKGTREGFGALLLGYYQNRQLVYCGRVGTGFDHASLMSLHTRLRPLISEIPIFANPPTRETRSTTWVRPELVAEIEFSEWTRDGILRHPVFQGLRDDKRPDEVVREDSPVTTASFADSTSNAGNLHMAHKPRRSQANVAAKSDTVAGITLSSPDRVLFPELGITKRQLAEYYETVADAILRGVIDRPLTLVRCPQGLQAQCFYQKHWTDYLPDAVDSVEIQEKSVREKYVVIHDLPGLIALVQMNVLELHPWSSRTDKLESPDRIIFDLDPGDGIAWEVVRSSALEVRRRLQDLDLQSWVRTTGGQGLHVVVPLRRRNTWEEVRRFAERFASAMVHDDPVRYVANMRKALRRGRIYVDYLRNQRGATAIASYSTRKRPGAPVATPLSWNELENVLAADEFSIANVHARLRKTQTNPWQGFDEANQSLTKRVLATVGGS